MDRTASSVDPVWLFWIEHHPGLATWVQAVFSVLAIFAAVGVAWMGVREQRLQGLRKERGVTVTVH